MGLVPVSDVIRSGRNGPGLRGVNTGPKWVRLAGRKGICNVGDQGEIGFVPETLFARLAIRVHGIASGFSCNTVRPQRAGFEGSIRGGKGSFGRVRNICNIGDQGAIGFVLENLFA